MSQQVHQFAADSATSRVGALREDLQAARAASADHDQQVARVAAHVRARSTDLAPEVIRVDASVFTDPARWERERRVFFHETPQLVGYSFELPGPGTFATKDVAGVPVLLVRDSEGELRAFLNVCSHRGATLAEGCGSTQRLGCPFHNWVYDLAGNLVGVPGREGFDTLDWSTLGLRQVPCGEGHGFIYVSLDVDAPNPRVDEILGPDLAEILDRDRPEVVPYKVDLRMDWPSNWKLTYDSFCENYHFIYLHKATLGDPGPVVNNLMVTDTWGWHSRETMCPHAFREAVEAGSDDLKDQPLAMGYFLYPNVVMIVTDLHEELFRIYPGDRPGTSYLYQTYSLRPNPAIAEFDDFVALMFDAGHIALAGEDVPMTASIQAKLDGGLIPHLVYGRNEILLQHNHRGWTTELGGRAG